MFTYAVRRLIQFIPTILAVTFILFLLLNVLPGDAAIMAGGMRQEADPKVMERASRVVRLVDGEVREDIRK